MGSSSPVQREHVVLIVNLHLILSVFIFRLLPMCITLLERLKYLRYQSYTEPLNCNVQMTCAVSVIGQYQPIMLVVRRVHVQFSSLTDFSHFTSEVNLNK